KEKALALQALEHWKVDPDLAAVRSPESLGRLGVAERREWEALWADLDVQIAKLKAGATGPAGLSGEAAPASP
ncbi:MAG: hypothetical protein ACYC61_02525, partial [Isosphaeraceae bacterium]